MFASVLDIYDYAIIFILVSIASASARSIAHAVGISMQARLKGIEEKLNLILSQSEPPGQEFTGSKADLNKEQN